MSAMKYLEFDYLFSMLLNKIQNDGNLVEVSSHFYPEIKLTKMFSYLWQEEDLGLKKFLIPQIVYARKSEEDAEKLREKGNQYYKEKVFQEALKLYNRSIMAAPHPVTAHNGMDVNSPNDMANYRSLAMGYANRSAVLFYLGQYEQCVVDVNRALQFGYPRITQSKLNERKAKCFLELGQSADAEKVVEESLVMLESLSLNESQIKLPKESLNSLLHQCQSKKQILTKETQKVSMSNLRVFKSKENQIDIFGFASPEQPQLIEANPNIPCLSNACEIAYTPECGRFLRATRDIYPGEVLIVEPCFASYPKFDEREEVVHNHCAYCLRRTMEPVPCPYCSLIVFCDENCRDKALLEFHFVECPVLPSLVALDMGKIAGLTMRSVIRTSFQKLKILLPQLAQESSSKPPQQLGFDSQGIYDSLGYHAIYHLVGNHTKRVVPDLFKRTCISVLVTSLLLDSKRFFLDESGTHFEPNVEDIVLIGSTILHHIISLPCNAHSITEQRMSLSNFHNLAALDIGGGVYNVCSLTNHSCNPTAIRVSYGSVKALRAIRFVPAGNAITDSYGEHYLEGNGSILRQMALQKQYFFTCSCEACIADWPSYEEVTAKQVLTCRTCLKRVSAASKCNSSAPVHCSPHQVVMETMRKFDKERLAFGIIGGEKWNPRPMSLENFVEKFQTNMTTDGKFFGTICETIHMIENQCTIPCKAYVDAQEMLKLCLYCQGSLCFVHE